MLAAISRNILLHSNSTTNCRSCGMKNRHDAVASVLNLTSARRDQRSTHNAIMRFERYKRHLVSEMLSHVRRAHDVREQYRASSGVVLRVSRKKDRTRFIGLRRAHEDFSKFGGHFHDSRSR